jgi:ribosomal-protein-alanine N-acetyltransferase
MTRIIHRGGRRDHSPMSATHMQTKSLKLVPQTLEEVRAMVEAMTPSEKAELSADWLARIRASTSADPWTHGFSLVHRDSDTVVGKGGFKGPPAADGVVEIAYGVTPDYQGKGYATEAAQALTAYAFSSGKVRVIRAHTRPEPNASTRVLAKCGFRRIGEVIDLVDGLVWRWEMDIEAAAEPGAAPDRGGTM